MVDTGLVVRVGETKDGEIVVRVIDTGQGIAARDLPRVFEPFYTSKDAGTGNGLGLAVAKGIVSDHGGEIQVSSVEGEGTEFRILFPQLDPKALGQS